MKISLKMPSRSSPASAGSSEIVDFILFLTNDLKANGPQSQTMQIDDEKNEIFVRGLVSDLAQASGMPREVFQVLHVCCTLARGNIGAEVDVKTTSLFAEMARGS